MNPNQRKILVALASYWEQWGSAPSAKQLAEEAKICMMQVYDEIYSLEKIGWVKFQGDSGARYPNLGARLTAKAEQYLPRLKELQ